MNGWWAAAGAAAGFALGGGADAIADYFSLGGAIPLNAPALAATTSTGAAAGAMIDNALNSTSMAKIGSAAPPPNGGNCPQHGGDDHDKLIRQQIDNLPDEASDLRPNKRK